MFVILSTPLRPNGKDGANGGNEAHSDCRKLPIFAFSDGKDNKKSDNGRIYFTFNLLLNMK